MLLSEWPRYFSAAAKHSRMSSSIRIWPAFAASKSGAQLSSRPEARPFVVPVSRRAPDVRERVDVARVEFLVEEARIEVPEVLEARLLDRPQQLELGQDAHHVVGRHDEVVVGHARLELGEHGLVRVVEVVAHLDAGPLRELVDDLLRQVLRPDVEVQLLLARTGVRRLVAAGRAGRECEGGDRHQDGRGDPEAPHPSDRSGGGCCSRWATRMSTTVTASSSVETALTSGVTPTFSIE